ncbi:hypothetical protein Tco_0584028 [Tanacetum coccineum]
MSEKQLIDGEINDITNDLSYKRFRGEKIDDEYERDCEIKIKQLLQDYSGLDIEMRKKERVLNGRKVSSGCFTHNLAYTYAATTITTAVASTRLKAKGIVFHDQEEQAFAFKPIVSSSQLPQAKDKGKGNIVEPEKPLKKKDQIALDEELALRLHAEEQVELEKERVAQEEASRAANIKELDSIQAMIEADEQLAARLQAEEHEQFSIEEKSRMLVEMIAERKKFFGTQRVAEQRSKPPTKTQIRNRMCAYLKNMGGYKHNQLKRRSYKEIQKLFDKAYKQKQKIDEHVEAKKADDQEEAEVKRHIEIVKDDEVAIDAIPLATKPLMIVEYKIDKDGRMGYFKLIRADGSSKRPEEDYERVLWIMPPRKAPRTRTTPATTTTTTSVTNAQLQETIDQGVTAALVARDANRNGDDNHTSGTGVRRTERVARECTYQDFMKCQPLYFKGT